MKNRIIFFLLLPVVCNCGSAQSLSEKISKIIKTRSDYVKDSIPEQFKWWYEPFTYSGDKRFYDIYDTLKTVLHKIPLSGSTFYWHEFLADDRSSKTITLWTDSLMIYFNCRWIAPWNRKKKMDDTIVYKMEIHDNLKNSLLDSFLCDFEDWNENVTNRSYFYWSGYGGGFILCSKVRFKSNQVEIKHTGFRYYIKDSPLLYLREQLEDNYNPRLQINCDWIINDKREETVWSLIENHKSHGHKVFDCEGKEL